MIYKNNPKTINKMAMRIFISIITLNVNGLNTLTKRQRVAEVTHTFGLGEKMKQGKG